MVGCHAPGMAGAGHGPLPMTAQRRTCAPASLELFQPELPEPAIPGMLIGR
jgi:hypothetical protein